MTEPRQAPLPISSSAPTALRRRRLRPLLSASVALCGFLVCAREVRAEVDADVNVQMPNVLLLVDTSGSMEYKTLSQTLTPAFPACKYDATGTIANGPVTSEKSRWVDLLEVLTGSISNYECQTLDRGSAAFKNEYKIVGSSLPNSPYDFLYANPYHRPLSAECAIGPGTISSTNPAAFPSNAFNYHKYNSLGTSCSFAQASDGILDSYKNNVRFGLMTFDTDPSPDQSELGTYSYVVGNSHTGKPIGCTTASPMEVGARNASAPPWEGRLIPFGDPKPTSTDFQTKNQQVQQVLLASRPYGATPIAGMLSDARDFLWNDTSFDPVDPSQHFGPASDPYRSCRNNVVLLLSDGQPNMDLRGHCTGNDCPFQLPEDIAHDLLVGGAQPIKTYVVGFALDTLKVGLNTTIDCAALTQADLDTTPSALCTANPDNQALQACCNLARIAVAGDDKQDRHAYFANNREQLRSNISGILSQQFTTTSRTQAAFSGVGGTSTSELAPASSYRFFSNFKPLVDQPWAGAVDRERWTCDKTTHIASRVEPSAERGDLFANNLNSQAGRARIFYAMQPTVSADGRVHSEYSIRPNLSGTDPDGVGAVTGTTTNATASTFVNNVSPASMGLDDSSCNDTVSGVPTTLTAAQCRDKYLKWMVGITNDAGVGRCVPPVNQSPPPQFRCNLLGDIYHATPRIVNAPSELTLDDTYRAFQSSYAARPLMLYTSSNDGMLHAFKVASNSKDDTDQVDVQANNELWAFIPPQVLPHVPAEYPATHQLLLDGVSVVKEVVARKTSGSYPYVFERTVGDAIAGATASTTWRTILVQGFGGSYPGYFALDITNPDPSPKVPLDAEGGGPKFLWQLTSDANGKPLFGTGGATPTITTLLVDEDGSGAREVPVAILPGGSGSAGTAGSVDGSPGCARATTDLSKFSGYPPRPRVPCYTTNLEARSLTIVRLDNGKIIRSFRRSKLDAPSGIRNRVIESPLDSPITGEPVAFPSDVGSVADRIFVGDQDGTLWKVDVSSKLPDQWKMSLFWDAFPAVQIHSHKGDWNSGQPIATAPVLSVDSRGNLTLAVSTGDQGSLGAATGTLNYVWSLRDLPNANHDFLPDLLWLQQFEGGERVTGPISLFNSYLYFSTVTPPPPSNACQATNGARIWGMHYMIPRDGEGSVAVPPDRTVGGQPAPFILNNYQSTAQFVTDTTLLGSGSDKKAVIYGATVAQVPTCYSEDAAADAYLGAGTRVSGANPGSFQLVIQTGSATLTTGGKGEAAAPKGALTITLPKLATPARIEAWASIVE